MCNPKGSNFPAKKRFNNLYLFLLFIISVFCSLIVATTVFATINYNYPSFYWDEIDNLLGYFLRYDRYHILNWIFRFHNEHRIAVPQFLFLLDWHVFKSNNIFLKITNLLFVFSFCYVCTKPLYHSQNPTRSTRKLIYPLIATCFAFSLCQLDNFEWGFQVQFIGVYAFTLLSIYFIDAKNDLTHTYLSIMFAVMATYSMSNGLLVWPIVLLIAFIKKVKLLNKIIITSSFLIAVTTFLLLPSVSQPILGEATKSISTLIHLIPFILTLLGSPFSEYSFSLGQAYGLLTLCYILFLFHSALTRGKFKQVSFLFYFIFFIILTFSAIAYGRSEHGIYQAISGRYRTPAMLMHATAILITGTNWLVAKRFLWIKKTYLILQTATVFFLIFVQFNYLVEAKERWLNKCVALNAIQNNIYDHIYSREIHPHFEEKSYLIRRLKTHPTFQETHNLTIPTINLKASKNNAVTEAQFTLIKTPSISEPGDYFICYGYINHALPTSEKLWIFNETGDCIGTVLVVENFPTYDVFRENAPKNEFVSRFYGHVRNYDHGSKLRFFKKRNGRLELLASGEVTKTVDTSFSIARRLLISDLKNGNAILEHAEDAWVLDENMLLLGDNGKKLKCFQSGVYIPNRSGSLTFRSKKENRKSSKIVIPYMAGNMSPDSTIKICDAETGNLVRKVELFGTHGQWVMLKFTIPSDIKNFRITVNENGLSADQWVVIAQPCFP